MTEERIVKEIRAALEKDRINLHRYPIQMAVQNGDLILDGVVADIAAKKLALLAAAETHGVQRIVDRLKVTPAEKMSSIRLLSSSSNRRRCQGYLRILVANLVGGSHACK